jgi:hypothetical protein
MRMQWHLTLPELGNATEEEHFAPLLWALEGMATVNEHIIKWAMRRAARGISPMIPPVYASGVRYQEDPAGREDWRDCLQVMQRGVGDCDQLVSWRLGELRVAGHPCEPAIKWQHIPKEVATKIRKADGTPAYPASMVPDEGLWLVHCAVKHANGAIEDISKNLGMGGQYTSAA